MLPILTAEAMREADRRTMEDYGLPGFTLMESAGRAAAERILDAFGSLQDRPVLVLAGKGNNGGDGLVVARVLHSRGVRVHVVSLATRENTTDDTKLNLQLLQRLINSGDEQLTLELYAEATRLDHHAPYALIVDALLGTGITSAVRGAALELVEWMNAQATPVVALDVPSGVESNTGRVPGEAVRADLTVTMAAPKVGLWLNEGVAHAGHVETVEIGIPTFILEDVAQQSGCAWQVTDEVIRDWLPHRAEDAHKYSAGFALIVAGSNGLTGAPVLASESAARSGAGAVVCACPSSIQPILAAKLTTVMTLGLEETHEGTVSMKALDIVLDRAEKADALLIGCGLGQASDTQAFVRELVRQTPVPLVIDADGLNALAGHTDLLAKHAGGEWILTPHWGEFKRLTGRDDLDIRDRVTLAVEYAERWNCVLILKGMPSVVGRPDGTVIINATGNPALATAGSGDTLAGVCVGFRAQGLPADRAAVCALHLGGAAADLYATRTDPRTMQATDLIALLPEVLHGLSS